MKNTEVDKVMAILTESIKNMPTPIVTLIKIATNSEPYAVLISTMLSLRTKDETTKDAYVRLFEKANTPHKMIELGEKEISKLIYPVGFYKVKAKSIIETSEIIINKYNGKVPNDLDELLTLKGVGRKTANLVITEAFNKDGICVDTHVHRISNRLGYINTKNPLETEMALRDKLPLKYWKIYNDTLVTYGQNLCRPIKPKCEECEITSYCKFYKDSKK